MKKGRGVKKRFELQTQTMHREKNSFLSSLVPLLIMDKIRFFHFFMFQHNLSS